MDRDRCPKCGAELLDPLRVYAGIPKLPDGKDRQLAQATALIRKAQAVIDALGVDHRIHMQRLVGFDVDELLGELEGWGK